ncbi:MULTISPECIES: hypothetical protein [unclassified Ensifer]|uniref:hypothetical protein n=1 Tax=unclassified Ensifer TaxID=2633371 RepID=UPI0007158C2D|nr:MULTISPECIES: hypothetical protein [unclassified Ensifer]KQX51422.1 hypothetical protein ASD49_31900 [Ensifer sp. Root1298]KQX83733.1 hypothetical protein ASD41_32515 [Ensifer sp. Root1312]KRC20260.1 hypothetical protein ASE29_31930 [Ensifer sp. Root74]KRD78200.1 hypothetical protein ASE71_16335 [Ensifer sp. Root954]
MFDPVEGAWISPTELNFLQRIFDRVCMWCQIDRPSKRADHLATYLLHEYRAGIRDETALFEAAMWREARRSKSGPKHEHDKGLDGTIIN